MDLYLNFSFVFSSENRSKNEKSRGPIQIRRSPMFGSIGIKTVKLVRTHRFICHMDNITHTRLFASKRLCVTILAGRESLVDPIHTCIGTLTFFGKPTLNTRTVEFSTMLSSMNYCHLCYCN